MQLTRFTDYGLRVLMYLANAQEQRTTIREVSRVHGISEQHLKKVVHRLSTLGYLKASRGKGGGIQSARPPAEISIGKVIRAMEPLEQVECEAPGYDGACVLFPACALRGALRSAQLQYLKALDGFTLADVTPKRPLRAARMPAKKPRA
jgi:Rrf2 family nitric oxide-sensitive transcriptional repressor